jgi:hypothetical protein
MNENNSYTDFVFPGLDIFVAANAPLAIGHDWANLGFSPQIISKL